MNESKVGRPKGYSPCGNVKSEKVRVYVDEFEAAKLKRLKDVSGLSQSEIMRMALDLLYRSSKPSELKQVNS